jgi:hypothetical protein
MKRNWIQLNKHKLICAYNSLPLTWSTFFLSNPVPESKQQTKQRLAQEANTIKGSPGMKPWNIKAVGPSTEQTKTIVKERIDAVQDLPHGPLMVGAANIEGPSRAFDSRKI